MAKNETIFFTKEGKFKRSPGSTVEDLVPYTTNGCKVYSINAVSLGGSNAVDISIENSNVAIPQFTIIGVVSLSENENLLKKYPDLFPKDKNGNAYFNLGAGQKLITTNELVAYYEEY